MDMFFGFLEVWEDQPGGRVVKRFKQDGIDYVLVEFQNSPGKRYLYLAS